MNNIKKKGVKLSLFLLLSLSGLNLCLGQLNQTVTDGLCDLRQQDLSKGIIALSGYWNFYPSILELSGKLPPNEKTSQIVPSIWNDDKRDKSGTGFSTYSIRIIVPSNIKDLAFEIPQLYSSYYLFVNDSLVAKNGIVGKSKEESIPEWKPQVARFSIFKDTVDVTLQISNFDHYKGGIREPILFGSASTIADHYNNGLYTTIGLAALVFVIGVLFLLLYVIENKKKETLYFGLFCMVWSVRLMFTDLYAVNYFVDSVNWNFQLRTEYITLFLVMIFASLFMNKLFYDLSSKTFLILVLLINALFIGFALLAEPIIFTRWLNLYIGLAVTILLYGSVMIIRALLLDQTGVWSLIAGIILIILLTGYDVIAFKGLVSNNLLVKNIGYGLIFICISIGILQHLGIIKGEKPVNRKLTIDDFFHKS